MESAKNIVLCSGGVLATLVCDYRMLLLCHYDFTISCLTLMHGHCRMVCEISPSLQALDAGTSHGRLNTCLNIPLVQTQQDRSQQCWDS